MSRPDRLSTGLTFCGSSRGFVVKPQSVRHGLNDDLPHTAQGAPAHSKVFCHGIVSVVEVIKYLLKSVLMMA